jgi:ssDNA-binding Zn-finger/Zn-ribbon topoisomerase 1
MRHRTESEQDQLTNYVLGYFSHLATDFEHDLMLSLNLDHKAVLSDSPIMKHKLGEERDEIIARITKPEVLALLPLGRDECFRQIRDRILKDHTDEVFFNRCPKCRKLARTPVAQMCPHCGNTWYDKHPGQAETKT